MHAVIVGSDMTAQTKFESELRNFVVLKKIQDRVHFVNKTLTVAPYLAAIDVLVQNSQVIFHAHSILSLTCCFLWKALAITSMPDPLLYISGFVMYLILLLCL